MIKDIGFYDDLTTPYYYSYSPYKKMWYEDAKEQLPEPDTLPEEVEHFSFKDTLEDWRTEPETIKEEFEKYIHGAKELFGYDDYSASLLLKSPKYEREICINCA